MSGQRVELDVRIRPVSKDPDFAELREVILGHRHHVILIQATAGADRVIDISLDATWDSAGQVAGVLEELAEQIRAQITEDAS